jgi:hypothetical protein
MFGLKKIKRNSMDKELEEVLPKNSNGKYSRNEIETAFEVGAKWQAERMYSEEDLKQAFRDGQSNMHYSDIFGLDSSLTEQQWFENFKKK